MNKISFVLRIKPFARKRKLVSPGTQSYNSVGSNKIFELACDHPGAMN